MQKTTKYIVLSITVVILCGIAIFAYRNYRKMEEYGYLSCISSIASEIQKLNDTKNLAGNSKEWKMLSEAEVNSLISQVHGYDCSVEDQTLDLWNKKLNIALSKSKDRVYVFVWSNGADKISGTHDDLIISYGEKVPQL
ncbi:hypothetical protein BH20ACI1_BH20ACI1_27220 [soil metagenome]